MGPVVVASALAVKKKYLSDKFERQKYCNDKLEEIWTLSFKILRSEVDVRAHLYCISLCMRVLLAVVTICS